MGMVLLLECGTYCVVVFLYREKEGSRGVDCVLWGVGGEEKRGWGEVVGIGVRLGFCMFGRDN